ncbi:hypothetical protein NLM31_01135 [Bradyrhizobium sp. CCGUVB4N]|uniref:hypothetical protein n=1 Tax=Bradyrhizobium sp. CCGUVB4N TaxID=2949631 RepID=UPI0020B35547|nr:hypothetical protein [Bradyrhizobium sp. CCGUVB4N]MCP3379045.1 hypothetical protein [Bradyrhizobium sp. CCGUVB4N]
MGTPAPSEHPEPPVRAWWNSRFVVPGLMLLSTVPFWFVHTPPLIDYLAHIGRYHVQLHLSDSPALQQNWDFHWQLVGNLGVELLIAPLAPLLGLERAAWLIALALPLLMISAIGRISRALHGELTPFAIAAAWFAVAYPFQLGFVNYWLGCALALHVFASWVETAGKNGSLMRVALFAAAACVVWLAHAYGWVVLVVLVGAFELCRSWKRAPAAWPAMVLVILRRAWPVMIPALLMIVWRQGNGAAATGHFFDISTKITGLVWTLRDQNIWLDTLSLLLAIGLLYFGIRSRDVRRNPALLVGAASLLILILLMPGEMFGAVYADVRLWPIFFIVGLTAIAPTDRLRRAAAMIAVMALTVFAIRIAAMAVGFAIYDSGYAQHLQALNDVPRGASIAVLTRPPSCERWRAPRVAHLGSLAIVRRDAFVNSQWDASGGQQLLTPLRARGTAFNADPSQYIEIAPVDCDGDLSAALAQRIAQIPRDRFDYIWLLDVDASRLPVMPGLRRLYQDDRSALYAFNKE